MKNEVAIMYSGGLDSYIAIHYARSHGLTPFNIYIDMGHPYAQKEMSAMRSLEEDFFVLRMTALYPEIKSIMTNQIIPSRNVLLGVLGGMFRDRVWICALDGEQNGREHDKSDKFYQELTNLLTYTNDFFRPMTIIETPFKEMSKAESVKWALENGVTVDKLLKTSSCYYDLDGHCGSCLTCYKRWVAFVLNGIDVTGHFRNPPQWSLYAHTLRQEIPLAEDDNDYSRFTKKRVAEHYRLMGMMERGEIK